MKFNYFNQFNISDDLAKAISLIISQKENSNYICKILNITIPEHKGLIFHSPLDGYEPWGGGLKALSGAQIQAVNEKYGWYTEGIISEQSFPYFVIVEQESLDMISKIVFSDSSEIHEVLKSLCVISASYFGSINVRVLIQRFPYLKDFFDYLDEWRAKTGRVTLDKDVLNEALSRTLYGNSQILKK